MQTPVPAPGKAPDSSTSTGDKIQDQSKGKRTPANMSPPTIDQNQSQTTEAHGNKQGNNNAEQLITVGKFPPVSITKDWTDRFYWGFSGLLVVVGGFQIWLLIRQLKIINRQTDIAEQQRTQMAQAGEQTERIIAQMKETEVRDLRAYVGVSKILLDLENMQVPEGLVEIQNFGKTPAYKVRHNTAIGIQTYPPSAPLPEIPQPERASVTVIFPQIKNLGKVALKKPLPQGFIVGTPNLTVYVYGNIRYEDAFGNQRTSNFRFIFGGTEAAVVYRDERQRLCGAMRPDSEGNDAD
jgi:hypothetical protein